MKRLKFATPILTLVAIVLCVSVPQIADADVLVSSSNNGQVLRYSDNGAFLGVFASGLQIPEGLAVDSDGDVFVGNNPRPFDQILEFDSTGNFERVVANQSPPTFFLDLAFGPEGNLFASDDGEGGNGLVFKYNPTTGAILTTLDSNELDGPGGLAVGPDNALYVASFFNDKVLQFDPITGTFLDVYVPMGSGGLIGPDGIAFGPDGDLYVSSSLTSSVIRYEGPNSANPGAVVETFITPGSGGLLSPIGLLFAPNGDLLVSSNFNDRVLRYQGPNGANPGQFLGVFASNAHGLDGPTYLAHIAPIPEPTSLALTVLGGLGLGVLRLARRGRTRL